MSVIFTIPDRSMEPEIPLGAQACCSAMQPMPGDLIAYAAENGNGPIFRRYLEKSGGTILLQAVNPAFDSYTTTPDEFRRRGQVYVILSIAKTFRKADDPFSGPEPEGVLSGEYLTFEEAQKLLKVRRTRMYALLQSGELPAAKMGRLWRIPRASVDRYLADCVQKTVLRKRNRKGNGNP